MNEAAIKQLEKAKVSGHWPKSPAPEQAAREVLKFLLTYAVLEGLLTLHPPELITPERHGSIRGSENPTWGVMWEDGPEGWASRLSLGEPIDEEQPETACDTTRHGCYAEPHYGFDLFWYPEEPVKPTTAAG